MAARSQLLLLMPPHFPPRPKQERIRTQIWHEIAREDNPFVPGKVLCHGYDVEALADRYGWTQMLFLLLKGELPNKKEDQLLNLVMASAINPGPRDAGVRAAMNCAIGKTPVATILTTGLTVRGGMMEGSLHVEAAARFFKGEFVQRNHLENTDHKDAEQLIRAYEDYRTAEPDFGIVPLPDEPPGFGLHFGLRDARAVRLLSGVEELGGGGTSVALAKDIESLLSQEKGIYMTFAGVFAASCTDLGFTSEQAAGLFLIAGTGGLLAHGLEQLPRKWNEYPFWADAQYYNYTGPDPVKKVEGDS